MGQTGEAAISVEIQCGIVLKFLFSSFVELLLRRCIEKSFNETDIPVNSVSNYKFIIFKL